MYFYVLVIDIASVRYVTYMSRNYRIEVSAWLIFVLHIGSKDLVEVVLAV
jgi:hypothetical protein